MEVVGGISGVATLVELSAKVASWCLKYSKDVKNARDDIVRMHNRVNDLGNVSAEAEELLRSPKAAHLKTSRQLQSAINDSLYQIERLEKELRPKTARQALSQWGVRPLKWPFQSRDVEKIVQDLGQCIHLFTHALQVDQTVILLDIDQKMVFDRLPVAAGAAFDSDTREHNPTCLPNTRVELLNQIADWSEDTQAKSIFWLNGMAGTGKSTISRTVAQSLAAKGYLGGSFFFKRGEADRGTLAKFFTTMTTDLFVRKPSTAIFIKEILDQDPLLILKNAYEQFTSLILQPLLRAATQDKSIIIFVVDALDECERDSDIKLMIHLFSVATSKLSQRIKFFLTSRPELPPRVGFGKIKDSYQDIILQDIPKPVIEHDISTFLEHELARIRQEYNASVEDDRQLPRGWPTKPNIQSLAEIAVPLFIFAATICRFVDDRKYGRPEALLTKVLHQQTKNHMSALAETYLLVLNQQINGLDKQNTERTLHDFRDIVGPIVILATPLTIKALGEILGISQHAIDDRLVLLHSVLSVPLLSTTPVRLLHLSFRDFLVDDSNRDMNPFWINEKRTHAGMMASCMRVLECLKQDLCDIGIPGTPRSTISVKKINTCLSPAVQYSCQYWIYHLDKAETFLSDDGEVHQFLTRHFLHWIEALALMGRALESLGLFKVLQSRLEPKNSTELSQFLDDATRFLRNYIAAIDLAPLQLYSSFLLFTPNSSRVKSTFKSTAEDICLTTKADSSWGQCIQTFEGHIAMVTSVTFSDTSDLVASASSDRTVRIWSADTGHCIQTLRHNDTVLSVAFLCDSELLVSSSTDKTVRIWRVITGECMHTLHHDDKVVSVAASADSSMVASASLDRSVRIWHVDSGDCIHTLHHDGPMTILSVAFSRDAALVVSASMKPMIRTWRTDTGESIRTQLTGGEHAAAAAFSADIALVATTPVTSNAPVQISRVDTGKRLQALAGFSSPSRAVAFSNNSSLVAAGSDDGSVRVWCVNTGKCNQQLEGHTSTVWSVAFSDDSKLIVSGSSDNTVRIWRTETGENTQVVESHSDCVSSVALSDDGALAASTSYDTMVRVWCTATGECMQTLEGHSDVPHSAAFSKDSALLVSVCSDGTGRIWRHATNECIQTLSGGGGLSEGVAFSYDASVVAAIFVDRTVVWRADTGECIYKHEGMPTNYAGGPFRLLFNITQCVLTDINAIAADCADHIAVFTYPEQNVGLRESGYGLSTDDCWITRNGENFLWLPIQFRPFCLAVQESTVVIGSKSGKVTILKF